MRAINRKLLRDFWSLRGQALAIAMVIAGGVATWIISYSTIDSLEQTQSAFYQEYRFAEVFAQIKRAPTTLASRIEEIPGVAEVQTRTIGGATLQVPGFGDPVTAQTVSIPDTGQPALNRLYMREGRLPEPYSPNEAAISEPFAEAHGLQPGDALQAIINGKRRELRISGIALSPEFVYQIRPGDLFPDFERYAILWMRNEPLAAAWDMEQAFNSVSLSLEGGTDENRVIDRLDRLLERYGGTGAFGRDDQLSHEYLSQELAGLKAMARIVPIIFLGVAAFLLSVVIGRIVDQQRDQIAVLKAFGYSNLQVGIHYVGLVMLFVTLGSLLGLGLGAWLGRGMSGIYSDFFRFPFLQYVLTPQVALSGVGVAAAAALIGTLRSVNRAVRLPPAEAMRPEQPGDYRPTIIERIGAQRFFDQPSRMIIRHLERRPLKSLLSVLGIAMAGAILMVGLFQEDAIDYMIDLQFGLSQRQDLMVTFTDPTARQSLFELATLPGVLRAEPFRAVGVRLRAGHRTWRTAIQGFENGGDLYRALGADLQPIELPPEGLLLTDYLAEQLGVKAGDSISVEVLEGARPVRSVPVVGLVNELIGLSGYMEINALNRLMKEGHVISGAFLAVDSARLQGVFDDLQQRPRILGIAQRDASIDAFEETMGETILVFAFVNVLLAGSIAFGVVYNSARITLSEHARELASLRVLGFTRGEISYILLGELAMLTLAAIPLGFAIGYGFAWLIAENLTSELYRIPLVLEASTYGFSAMVVLIAALLSGEIMRRRLYRLDLVAVLKTRE
nr:ABC transporter permease [Thiohalomonas denitrificans]